MRRVLASACAALAATAALAVVPPSYAARPDDGEAALQADADGPLRIRREHGVATFVGKPAGTDLDNPGVGRRTPASVAARAHLDRYGEAIGADRSGTRLVERSTVGKPGEGQLVRYQQQVGGVPVLGGEVVVGLGADHELDSLNAHLSDATGVPAPTLAEDDARAVAAGTVRRAVGRRVQVEDGGRWVLDPEAVGLDATPERGGVRGVWRFEVRAGSAVRRLVLVDDRTGDVLLDVDLVEDIDRTVCDRANVWGQEVPCTTDAVRTETSGPSAVADVEAAFAHAGATSTFYQQVGFFDLTSLIGYPTASGLKLSSTVRFCPNSGQNCPYANAFWNGQGMFYGQGYAAADDVVGHEMTHGVIERSSGLLYWDQPGAINESLADIIGEIVDHRNVGPGDTATDWRLGEDLPNGAIRDLANPPAKGQPDRMTSALWDADLRYEDGGGVHRNSGVGNKAFHLISQGGTFNGQTITGIDAGDPSLTRSGLLWVRTMAGLTAFTEYADLAVVLQQTCAQLVDLNWFTAADCTAVNKAILATELTSPPTSDPEKDAPRGCPDGRFPRALFDSETGSDPTAKLAPAPGWGRTPATPVNAAYGVNAYSGDTAWVAEDPPGAVSRSLRSAAPIAVPQGQPSYLAFRQWYLFDFGIDPANGTGYWYDGGTLEMTSAADDTSWVSLSNYPWDNGPTRVLQPPNETRKAFAGSSRGWIGSRVEITGFGGQSVRPTFTVRTDESYGGPGWYLDDILVYTCDLGLAATVAPTLPATTPRVGVTVSVTAPTWNLPDAVTSYQWRRDGAPVAGATQPSYTPVAGDVGTALSVVVTGTSGGQTVPVVLAAPAPVEAAPVPLQATTPPSLPATAPRVGTAFTVTAPVWNQAGVTTTYQWRRDGQPIVGATSASYTPVADDLGTTIGVIATGTRGEQVVELAPVTAIAAVQAAPPPLQATTQPSLPATTPQVGTPITVTAPVWNRPDVVTTYQWLRGDQPIAGATQPSYSPVPADVGTRLSVVATGTLGDETASVVAGPTTDLLPVLAVVTVPSLAAGAPRVGRAIAVTAPTWNLAGTIPTYQWRRNGQPLAGRTQATYTPVAADVGTRLSVVVTGTNGAQSKAVTAAASADTALGLLTAPRTVRTTGTPSVGRRLTAARGTWAPTGITFTYRWLRDGKVIAGATRASFVLRTVDRGHRVAVRITARKSGYATVVRTSAAVLVRR